MDGKGQNISVIMPGSFTHLRHPNPALFPGELPVHEGLVVRHCDLQGEAYIYGKLELSMYTRPGNTSMCSFLPALGHFSLLSASSIPQPWKDRARPVHTAAGQEGKLVGGKRLPTRRPSLLSLSHVPTCIGSSEKFLSSFQLCRRAVWPGFPWAGRESVAFGSPSRKGCDGGVTLVSLGAVVRFAEFTLSMCLSRCGMWGLHCQKKKKKY